MIKSLLFLYSLYAVALFHGNATVGWQFAFLPVTFFEDMLVVVLPDLRSCVLGSSPETNFRYLGILSVHTFIRRAGEAEVKFALHCGPSLACRIG